MFVFFSHIHQLIKKFFFQYTFFLNKIFMHFKEKLRERERNVQTKYKKKIFKKKPESQE